MGNSIQSCCCPEDEANHSDDESYGPSVNRTSETTPLLRDNDGTGYVSGSAGSDNAAYSEGRQRHSFRDGDRFMGQSPRPVQAPSMNEEQKKLNEILTSSSKKIIDCSVGAEANGTTALANASHGVNHAPDPQELHQRAVGYGKKLTKLPVTVLTDAMDKKRQKKEGDLIDIVANNMDTINDKAVSGEALDDNDRVLGQELAARVHDVVEREKSDFSDDSAVSHDGLEDHDVVVQFGKARQT